MGAPECVVYGVRRTLSPDANRGQSQPHHLECPQMIDEAFAEPQARTREPNGALLVLPDLFTATNRQSIIALAAHHRLPSVYPFRYFVASGGLMSYGIETLETYRQAASYVARILKGENPGDLPVQAPTKYELVINLKTAKALGLDVPSALLASADEVIE